MDNGGSQILVNFSFHWIHLIEWYDSFTLKCQYLQYISKGVLKVWSLSQQPWHHLGSLQRCKFSSQTPPPLNQKLWEQAWQSVFSQALQGILIHVQIWKPPHQKLLPLQLLKLTMKIYLCQFKPCEGTRGFTEQYLRNVWASLYHIPHLFIPLDWKEFSTLEEGVDGDKL